MVPTSGRQDFGVLLAGRLAMVVYGNKTVEDRLFEGALSLPAHLPTGRFRLNVHASC
jgi:hypothetical protein